MEQADDSTAVIPWTLSQARAGSAEMRTFCYANVGDSKESIQNFVNIWMQLKELRSGEDGIFGTVKANYAIAASLYSSISC